ncbi:thymidine phosphorylase-like [Phasianus colchicus]|uniref:thymidine phosphorylase-like n=1 Tax=Phasianus colchicus TaxID=9054 RepID=UPI00129D6D4C|nr:thymidine phosphorylase-like [Phasianus colchicus]
MGAGRTRAGEKIDPAVGAELLVEAGQRLREGDPWLRLHHNGRVGTAQRQALQSALLLEPDPVRGTDTDTGTGTGTAALPRIADIILPRTELRGEQ